MKLLSDLYNVTLKRGIRGKASEGFFRPTISQSFMSDRDFEEINKQLKYGGFDPNKRQSSSLSSDNLSLSFNVNGGMALSLYSKSSGKCYWEVRARTTSHNDYFGTGITRDLLNYTLPVNSPGTVYYESSGYIFNDGTALSGFPNWQNSYVNHIIGVALNLDDNEVTFYKNNVLISVQDIYNLSGSGPLYAMVGARVRGATRVVYTCNFSNTGHTYDAPEGFELGIGSYI